jgi:hypothetical protein
MSAFSLLIPPFLFPKKFQRSTECSATTRFYIKYITSVFCLSSLSSSAQTYSIQVSWYAFFQGWLLPSLPSCCFRLFTSFPLSKIFGTLFYVLGCFPLVHEASPSWTVYTFFLFSGVLSLLRVGNPSRYSALLPVLNVRATYIAFAEYQLSPSLISISPLISSHPPVFLHWSVRSSIFRLQSAQN